MNFKRIIKRKILGYKADSDSYIEYLKNLGVKIGKGVKIYRPFNTTIDIQNPHMLRIGNNVQMTGPVTILTHDYSWSIIKSVYGEILGNQQETVIGDNVFIGWGATILGGAHIGDNVIIGANAVVSGNVDSNSVYAGNPARKIMSLEEFKNKRVKSQLDEAVKYVLSYEKRFGKYPEESKLDEYFFLFKQNSHDLIPEFERKMNFMGNYDMSLKALENNSSLFNNYNEFIEYCRKKND